MTTTIASDRTARLRRWLLREPLLGQERARVEGRPAEVAALIVRAERAAALADHARAQADPLGPDLSLDLQVELYRQAVHWCDRAAAAGGETAPASGPDEADLEPLLAWDFVGLAARPQAELASAADRLRRAAARRLERLREPERRLGRLRRERLGRLLGAAAAAAAVVVAAALAVRGPDLAAGRPWKTSSTYEVCHPERHRCVGGYTNIFFHTKDDESPWWQTDLGEVRRVSRVDVVNREEFRDRALPLIVELSDDGVTFREVARRRREFTSVSFRFAPQRARYVRLRVGQKSWLHLQQVSVYR